MTETQQNLLDWLSDAHAMEQQAQQMLQAQIGRVVDYPELRARLELHLQETRSQQRLIASCLERLGASPSVFKDFAGRAVALGQLIGTMASSDEVVKEVMACYAFEHMEIAAYTALIAAAEVVGDVQTRVICEQILPEEQAMAQWLLDHLPVVSAAYLRRAALRDEAAQR
jgi:ferritin-like metal-binding protein YciE